MMRVSQTPSRSVRKAVVGGAITAVVLGIAACGCGQRAVVARPSYNTWRSLASELQSTYGGSDKGIVIDGRLVTWKQDDLRGSLPPAQPVDVITQGNPKLKRVALTLDDGWNADMRILDLLKKWKIKFTTFLIGDRGVADANPDFVKAIKDAGGEVCSHTWDHYVMKGKDEGTVMDEIWKSQEVIAKVTHEIYPYMRFSGGLYDQASLQWTAREGFWMVNWSISDNDTAPNVTPDSQVNAILGNLKPGAIILCHWGGHNTYEVLARAIPEIQKRGYEVTSLTRVFEGTPYILKGTAGTARK